MDKRTPEDHINAIAETLRSSARDRKDRKIGIEIERIGIWPDCTPFGYEDTRSAEGEHRPGAETLLRTLSETYGWPLTHNAEGKPLGASHEAGNISLEPGSQIELSTEATQQLSSLVEKAKRFESQVDRVTCDWGLTWIGLGVNPCNRVEDIDVIPSPRYGIMTEYLQKQGSLATSMMRLTSSVQINLDYQSEKEAIEMLHTGLAAAPISYVLFSNSPLVRGKETEYLSYRYWIWKNTDPDRAGLFHEAFESGFDFSAYAKWAWNTPLMFAKSTSGTFVPALGKSLSDIYLGKLPGVEINEENLIWPIRQFFGEARIKPGYVEIRSVDGQKPSDRYASAAFWMGLLYDRDARHLVIKKLGSLSKEKKEAFFEAAAKKGMGTKVDGICLTALSKELLEASSRGLKKRGFGEEAYLEPIYQNLEDMKCPADRVLEKYRGVETKKIRTVLNYVSCDKPT